MNVLFDTSVLVAALVASHPAHTKSFRRLEQVFQQTHQGFIATHTLAELYAILTRLPIQPNISSREAQQLIEDSVLSVFDVVALSLEDYKAILNNLVALNLVGGVVYDALIMHIATKIEIDEILTLNEKDFKRLNPLLAKKVVSL